MRKKKYLFMSAFMALWICAAGANAEQPSLINFKGIRRALADMLVESGKLKERAKHFDQRAALLRLGSNKLNGFYFRFDEHLEIARAHPRVSAGDNGDKTQIIRFAAHAPYNPFNVENGEMRVSGDSLKLRVFGGSRLNTDQELNLDVASLESIAVRLKMNRNTQFWIVCSTGGAINWDNWVNFMKVDAVHDGKFHTYIVNDVADKLNAWYAGKKIKKIILYFNHSDEVELASIELLGKKSKYDRAYGCGRRQYLGGEIRPVLYMRTPMSLRYKVRLPEKRAYLSFSMAVENNSPVTFKVFVRDDYKRTEIFSRDVLLPERADLYWTPEEVLPLEQWRGRNVEISFEATAGVPNVAFWSSPMIFSVPNERFNVVLIMQDSLRADHLSAYGYNRETSPFQDAFAKKGALFEYDFSQGPMTIQAYATLMTSLYSPAINVRYHTDTLDRSFLTLPEIMRSQGFKTANFTQNVNAGGLPGLDQGFDAVDCTRTNTEELLAYAARSLESSPRNQFLYLHILSPHSPYDPPEQFRNWYYEADAEMTADEKLPLNSWDDPPWMKRASVKIRNALYDGQIRGNDSLLASFLHRLEKSGLQSHTLVIITGDHGDMLGERGQWFHGGPSVIQIAHVPLIMVYPAGIPAATRIRQNVQQIDIMPTILDFAHIPKKGLLLQGRSLVPLMKEEDIYSREKRPSYSDTTSIEPSYCASVFYKNLHVMATFKNESRSPFNMQVYDFHADKSEQDDLCADLPEGMPDESQIYDLIKRFEKINVGIWENVTRFDRSSR